MSRYARKIDANQVLIVHQLRKAGFSVAHTHTIAGGFPDLVISGNCPKCHENHTVLVEVKAERGKLTPDQVKFRANWRGHIIIATTASDVLDGIRFWCCDQPPEAA